jgi:hypothetical protein
MGHVRPGKSMAFLACIALLIALGVTSTSAQEATKVSGKITAAYTNQDSIAVGDITGHILSLSTSEGKNVNTGEHAFMDGAQIVVVSYGDLILGNGVHHGYIEFTKNDDAIYAKWEGKVTTVQATGGAPVTSFEGTLTYTKGTGKFRNIKGSGTYKGEFISKTEYYSEWQTGYSIEK